LDVAPADQVLEFGCGPGVAVSLVAERLAGGCVTAIDRSATAVSRARSRNRHHLEAGRLLLEQVALAEFRTENRFDKAFGVNVNLFWTTPAQAECEVLTTVLAPGAAVHLVYDAPTDRGRDVAEAVAATLSRHGFTATVSRGLRPSLVSISGRRSACVVS
jgi:trans-aconitate methyltransferase